MLHISIVDDNEELCDEFREYFQFIRKNKCRVSIYNNPLDFLNKVYDDIPDLFIIDLNLPVISGFKLIGELLNDSRTSDISIIAISGFFTKDVDLINIMKLKGLQFINKPFDFEDIEKIMRDYKIIE